MLRGARREREGTEREMPPRSGCSRDGRTEAVLHSPWISPGPLETGPEVQAPVSSRSSRFSLLVIALGVQYVLRGQA